MKKILSKYGSVLLILLFIVAICLFIALTADKEYNTICKLETTDPAGDYNMKATYNIVYNKKGNVNRIEIKEEYTELKKGILDELYNITNLLNSTLNSTYGGHNYKNDYKDDILIVNTTINIEELNLEKYSNDMGFSKYVERNKINKEAFINKYKDNGAICEE